MRQEQRIKTSKKKSIGVKGISYKNYIKRIKTVSISTALATILATNVIIKADNTLSDLINQQSVDSSVKKMVMVDKSKSTLLDKYSYPVGNGEHFAYNLLGVASELVKCPAEDFDIILFSVYNGMQYKSNNIDELFKCLNIEVSHIQEENPELYYKLKDVNSFDDYLRKLNLTDADGVPSKEKYEKYGEYLNELQKDALKYETKQMKSEEKSSGKRY